MGKTKYKVPLTGMDLFDSQLDRILADQKKYPGLGWCVKIEPPPPCPPGMPAHCCRYHIREKQFQEAKAERLRLEQEAAAA